MVVDANGAFMTARNHPGLLHILAEPGLEGRVTLRIGDDGIPFVGTPNGGRARISTAVWGTECEGISFDAEIDRRLSGHLGEPCRLVYMTEDILRPVTSDVALPDDRVSYADGFPLLLTNQSSLDDLNMRVDSPLEMLRFRPNLVVEGTIAFAELNWARIRIGDLEFVAGGPCVRCKLTTLDPVTGERRTDGEPLKTLATYQKNDHGTLFGINLIPRGDGELRIGQPIEVLE